MPFLLRMAANFHVIHSLYYRIYSAHPERDEWFSSLLDVLFTSHKQRPATLQKLDERKEGEVPWYVSNDITGMSLYVDRFAGSIEGVNEKLDYFSDLGVNFLHLMPIMESPAEESDGGYAVSDFRSVDKRFGTMEQLQTLIGDMHKKNMYLMLDIVLNHTSDRHEWAVKASAGDHQYQNYYYMFDSRNEPDIYERTMPDIFPDSSPGSFTYDNDAGKWVMTVFNYYQWDLNYTNPEVFVAMLDNILYYANLGVDILRIDAPAFIWKQMGTPCQNLPEAHILLQLIKHCVQVSAPGMALLGEAIVAPAEIMKYFGNGVFTGRECDIAYNATHMALQWDALATGDIRVMLAAQPEILQKPYGTTWITYTRCHDDIGLGYDDYMISAAGFNPPTHRAFLKEYYSGNLPGSPAKGALFGVNPKTNDARISGSLASLCGLETALIKGIDTEIDQAIQKIVLMQAHSLFLGGIPVLFYGDECGYTNDYSYTQDPAKNYDNRWMHRPLIDWQKNALRSVEGTVEQRIFDQTKKLIQLRRAHAAFQDVANLEWLTLHNVHVAGYVRQVFDEKIICLFNFSNMETGLTWFALKEKGWQEHTEIIDLWTNRQYLIGPDNAHLLFAPYQFMLFVISTGRK